MSDKISYVDRYVSGSPISNKLTPLGLLAVFVRSAITPVSSSTPPIYSSVSSSYPRIRIESVFSPLPTLAASLVISIAAVANATVSSKVLFAAAIADDERVNASTMSALLTANALPTALTLEIMPSMVSSTSISKALMTLTRPSVAIAISISGDTALKIAEFLASSAASVMV